MDSEFDDDNHAGEASNVDSDSAESDPADGAPTSDDPNQVSFLDTPQEAAAEPEPQPDELEPAPVPVAAAAPAEAEASGDYQVLARKYRPQTFDEVIGQEALVRTLTNAFELDRVAHAFILTGVRGVGKTTTARIIAKCLNATDGPTIAPDPDDEQCIAIAEDRHPDVIEVDAASRTGVDDIREILDGVRYRPAFGRYKVYIIDEVHMLSRNAFNALLKTLEEPPEHVKFIFATTEIRKVPVTVLSRCQRFDLRRVGADLLMQHFAAIAGREGAKIEEGALRLIARAADGSVRDGLSLLDQAIAAHGSGGATATEEQVRDMLGIADAAGVFELFEAVLAGRTADALAGLRRLYDSGADPIVVLQDMLALSHWVTRIKLVPEAADDPAVSENERNLGRAMAEKLPVSALSRAWQILLKGVGEVQRAPAALPAVEMVLIRLAHAAELPAPADIVARLAQAPQGGQTPQAPAPGNGVSTGAPAANGGNGGAGTGGGAPGGGSGPRTMAALAPQPHEDMPPEVEAAPQPEAQAHTPDDPASFRALVELFGERREADLRNHLYRNVHLVSYEPGRLEFHPVDPAPQKLAGDVLNCLRNWFGTHWQVSVSREEGAPTLAEQDKATEQAHHDAAARHPVVQAALEAFPGARIERVTVHQEDDTSLAAVPDPAADMLDGDDEDEEL